MENFSNNVNYLSWNDDGEENDYHHHHHLQTSSSQLFHHHQHIYLDDFSQQAHRDPEQLMAKPVLGLKLSISESLENMITQKLQYQRKSPCLVSNMPTTQQQQPAGLSTPQVPEKQKASNVPVSMIVIGNWERKAKNEVDLVAKCYFAKKKLVWEFLFGGLKSKIEIQWSDVLSLSTQFQENPHGILNVELSQPPTFYQEMAPQPRKHTQWRLTSDFTNGQASLCRRHALYFAPGTLEKHYGKILQPGNHLYERSQVPFPSLTTPFFHNFKNTNSTLHHPSQLNPAFHFSFDPSPHHPFPPDSLSYYYSSSPSPILVVDEEPLNNTQTRIWFQDQSQKSISPALLGTQVFQDVHLINTADALHGPQVNIPKPMRANVDEFQQQQGLSETTVKPEEQFLQEVQSQIVLDDDYSIAFSDLEFTDLNPFDCDLE